MHGDCFKLIDKLIADGVKVDAIITDPPYDINNVKAGQNNDLQKRISSLGKELETAKITKGYDIVEFGEKAIKLMKDVNIYLWCNKVQIPEYFNFWIGKHKCKFDIISWHKTNALPTYSNKYLSDTEYCLYFRKGKGKCFPQCYDDAKTYYINPLNQKDKKLYGHPTIKPLDFIEKMVRNSSKEGDIILDPFMGSGTTGVACKNLNRNFIGMELNFDYYMTAYERINNKQN